MTDEFEDVLDLTVRCDVEAPSLVRRALDRVELSESVRDDARLVATELVGNAILYPGCTSEHELHVRARLNSTLLEISVHDPDLPDNTRKARKRRDRSVGGLGLLIVERLSWRWGVLGFDGRLVWAQLRVRPPLTLVQS
jgi:anti-sigma regulatory factor (Ser/Thr protein kinase)